MAFGHGTHFCIGANLARVELQLLFGEMTRRFRAPVAVTEPEVERNIFARVGPLVPGPPGTPVARGAVRQICPREAGAHWHQPGTASGQNGPVTTTVSASAPPKLGYRPSLDGLRAVSVMAVVLYHAGVSWMPGGFLGVEVFFVVSGFLITALLIDERHHSGAISLRQFWIRRARRLLPALYLLLAVVSVASMLVYRDAAGRMGGDVLAALFYVSNWWQIYLSESYFAQAGRPPLLQHLWSLAIEEQFYLVFPPLFALGLARRGRKVTRWVLIGLALASSAWMAHPVRGVHGPLQRLLLHLHPGLRPAARRGPGPQLGPVADSAAGPPPAPARP